MSDANLIEAAQRQRDEYWTDAREALARHEFRKAAEMIWGAVTQQLKAVAWLHDQGLGTHRQFFEFARQLTLASGDPYWKDELRALEHLHVYFYEDAAFDPSSFPEYMARAERYIARLRRFLPHGGLGAPAGGPPESPRP